MLTGMKCAGKIVVQISGVLAGGDGGTTMVVESGAGALSGLPLCPGHW